MDWDQSISGFPKSKSSLCCIRGQCGSNRDCHQSQNAPQDKASQHKTAPFLELCREWEDQRPPHCYWGTTSRLLDQTSGPATSYQTPQIYKGVVISLGCSTYWEGVLDYWVLNGRVAISPTPSTPPIRQPTRSGAWKLLHKCIASEKPRQRCQLSPLGLRKTQLYLGKAGSTIQPPIPGGFHGHLHAGVVHGEGTTTQIA